jgi:hypothetical protein
MNRRETIGTTIWTRSAARGGRLGQCDILYEYIDMCGCTTPIQNDSGERHCLIPEPAQRNNACRCSRRLMDCRWYHQYDRESARPPK